MSVKLLKAITGNKEMIYKQQDVHKENLLNNYDN